MRERTEYVSIIGLYRDYLALLPTNPLVSLSNSSGLVTQGIMKHTNLSKSSRSIVLRVSPVEGLSHLRSMLEPLFLGDYRNIAPE